VSMQDMASPQEKFRGTRQARGKLAPGCAAPYAKVLDGAIPPSLLLENTPLLVVSPFRE
jgi:hypothetical protein